MTEQPPDRILRLSAVLDRTGLTRATLYRKIQQGTFPSRCASPRAVLAGGNPPSVNGCIIPCSIRSTKFDSA
jgi:hypothetical protein